MNVARLNFSHGDHA